MYHQQTQLMISSIMILLFLRYEFTGLILDDIYLQIY